MMTDCGPIDLRKRLGKWNGGVNSIRSIAINGEFPYLTSVFTHILVIHGCDPTITISSEGAVLLFFFFTPWRQQVHGA